MPSEIQIQAKITQYIWNHYPQTRRKLFHVPNGGSRNIVEGMQLKAAGVIPGIPDLLFIWRGRIHAFELKTESGPVSPAQKKVHAAWAEEGITVHIIRSEGDGIKMIEDIIISAIPTRKPKPEISAFF